MKGLRVGNVAVGAMALALSGIANAETLKEVVTFVIETNPQVVSTARRKDAADSAIEAAKGGYYPKIDFLYGAGRERSKNLTTLATTPDHVTLGPQQEAVVINQMLWDGLGVKSEVDRRRAIAESTVYKVYGTAEDIAQQAIQAYLDVLRNRGLLGYAEQNLAAHQKTYDQVKLRSEKGVGRRADLEQIDARLSLAVSNVAAAQSTLRESEITYLKVVGKAPVNLTLPASPQNIPRSVDEAVKIGFQNNPILKSAQTDIDAAQAQRAIARSFLSPRFELELRQSTAERIGGFPGPNRSQSIMFLVKWNLFRGGFDYYRLGETGHQISEATEIARNTGREVENAVRLAYNNYVTARDRVPPLEKYVKSSDATRVAYRQQFSIGQRTLLDLLDSENEFFTAQGTLLNAQFIELSNRYQILKAMGQLLTTLDVNPPEQGIIAAPQ